MPKRVVVDLDQGATILDVAARLAAVPADADVVLIGAAGAPWLRSAVFIEVARSLVAPRRFAIVTSDPRSRSLAASVHVPAYASVAALDRQELDATERLDRRSVAAAPTALRLRRPTITRRAVGAAGSLLLALAILLAVVVPEATVVVAPTTREIAPIELEVSAGPGGGVPRTDLSDTVTAMVPGVASGSRTEQTSASGTVQLQNRQTSNITIPRGTIFQTSNGIRFQSTEERTLPRSIILFPLPTLSVGTVDVPVEAVVPGTAGNVERSRITVGPAPNNYTVNNPQPTTGGETKLIPIIRREDYIAAQNRAAAAVQVQAEMRLARWRSDPPAGTTVIPRVYSTLTSLSPESEVIDKEVERFELRATGIATAFAVPATEPRQTVLARLRSTVAPGFDLDEPSATVNVTLLPDQGEPGLIRWRVTASGSQLAVVDDERIRRALVGRSLDEARAVLDRLDIRLVEITTEPSWWPRIPVLDARIRIAERPATAAR